jgi:hypothetical protein
MFYPPEKFNLQKASAVEGFDSWAIFAAMAEVSEKDAGKIINKSHKSESGDVEVVFAINGVQLPFAAVMKRLEAEYDRQVGLTARAAADDYIVPLHNLLYEAEEAIKRLASRATQIADEDIADED